MKILLPLLTILLCNQNVHLLVCYFCNDTTYAGCPRTKNCSESEGFCTKYSATSISGFILHQGCSVGCPVSKTAWPSLYTFTCCQENWCNHVPGVRGSKPLLAVATIFGALADLDL